MKKKMIAILCFLFTIVLTSCHTTNNSSISYSYTDPSYIEQNKVYNVNLIENDYITVTCDNKSVAKGEVVNFLINDIEPGYSFLGWYVNDMYKGDEEWAKILIESGLKSLNGEDGLSKYERRLLNAMKNDN